MSGYKDTYYDIFKSKWELDKLFKNSVLYVPVKAKFNDEGIYSDSESNVGLNRLMCYFYLDETDPGNSHKASNICSSKYNRLYKSVSKINNLFKKSSRYYGDMLERADEEDKDVIFFAFLIFVSIISFLEHPYNRDKVREMQRYGERNYTKNEIRPSQILYDIEKLEVFKDKKQDFYYQTFSELEADEELFNLLMDYLDYLKNEDNVHSLMIWLADSSIASFKSRGINNVVRLRNDDYFIVNSKNENDEVNNMLINWNEEKDEKLRRIFVDCMEWSLSDDKIELLNNSPEELEQYDAIIANLDETNVDEIIRKVESMFGKIEGLEAELKDKLMALEVMENYFLKVSNERRITLWNITTPGEF